MGEETSVESPDGSHDPIMISNALLGYIFNCMHFSTVQNLRTVVLSQFSSTAIHQAKETLAKSIDDDVIGSNISINRRGSTAKAKSNKAKGKVREKEEMELDDIIEAMEVLDKAEVKSSIKVSFQIPASELHLLPRTRPEDLLTVTAVETIKRLEERVHALDTQVAKSSTEMSSLTRKVENLERGSYACPTISSAPSAFPPLPWMRPSTSAEQLNDPAFPTATPSASELSSSLHPAYPRSYSQVTQQPQGEEDEWTKVQKAKSRSKPATRKEVKLATKDLRVVTGKGNAGSDVKGSLPAKHIYVYRVSSEVTTDSIKDFLTTKKIDVRGIRKVSKDDWLHSSFKVVINASDLGSVLDEGFWPEGVCCREWLSFIPKQATNQVTNETLESDEDSNEQNHDG